MATARQVRAAVRAQLAEEMKAREDAALTVAKSWAKVSKERDRLAAVEQEAATEIAAASRTVPLGELATLSGVPVADLRRLLKSADTAAPKVDGHRPASGADTADRADGQAVTAAGPTG